MQLSDFEVLHFLGSGSYGKVQQVRKISGENINKVYALKTVKTTNHRGITVERNILSRIKHPFVVELFYTFENDNKFYFVLEYLCGGTLSKILDDNTDILSEHVASFYIKEGIVALEYLHSEGIIYRDLKHNNILLDINGHIKIIDFGLSEENFTHGKLSYISCGTPYYKAPEIINKVGHGFAVDWWALGVLFYRMVAGQFPFLGSGDKKVRSAVLEGKFTLPDNLSPDLKDLITKLLQVNEKERLGYDGGALAIKQHQFFKNTCWTKVAKRLETPPIVPQVANAEDVSRFPVLEDVSTTISETTSSNYPQASTSSLSNSQIPEKKVRLDSSHKST